MISQTIITAVVFVVYFLLVWLLLTLLNRCVIDKRPRLKKLFHKIRQEWLEKMLSTLLMKSLVPDIEKWIAKRGDKKTWRWVTAGVMTSVLSFTPAVKYPARSLDARLFPEPPSFLYIPKQRTNWLDFRSRYLPLVGRDAQMSALNDFLFSDDKFSWWWLKGKPASDANRIALEWVLQQPSVSLFGGNHAGFFSDVEATQYWKEWQPRRRTVIVIYDIADYADTVLVLLKTLGKNSDKWKYPVRVLLVGRSLPMTLKDLEYEEIYTDYRYDAKPLVAGPLEVKHLRILARKLSSKKQKPFTLTPELEDKIMDLTQGFPLLLAIAVDTILKSQTLKWSSHEDLLHREIQKMTKRFQQEGLDQSCLPLLALSTFCRGLPWTAAEDFHPNTACHNKGLLDKLFEMDTVETIPPIEPQLLGEYFVLERFESLNEIQRHKFVTSAWTFSPRGVAGTLNNLLLDFPGHSMVAQLDVQPTKEEALVYWAKARINVTGMAEAKHISLVEKEARWQQVLDVARELPDNSEIAWVSAGVTAHMIHHFGEIQDLAKMEKAIGELRRIARVFHNDIRVVKLVLAGLTNSLKCYYDHDRCDNAVTAFKIIQSVSEKVKNDSIQMIHFAASANVMNCYGKLGRWEELDETLVVLDDIIARSPSVVLHRLASGAFGNAIRQFLRYGRLTKASPRLQRLREIAVRFPEDSYIQLEYAKSTADAMLQYKQQECRLEMKKSFQDLVETTARFVDNSESRSKFQSELARGAANCINRCVGQTLDDMLYFWDVLRNVGKRYPRSQEIREHIAMGGANALELLRSIQNAVKVPAIFEVLIDSTHDFPGSVIIKNQFIHGIEILLGWGPDPTVGRSLDSCQKVLSYLIEVSKRTRHNPEVQVLLAAGAASAIPSFGDNNLLDLMQEIFDFLYSIGRRYPDDKQIQFALAGGCANAIKGYNDAGSFENSIRVFRILEAVEKEYPQNTSENEVVKHLYVYGGVNAIRAYGEMGEVDKALEVFNTSGFIAKQYSENEELQLHMTKAAVNITKICGVEQMIADMQKAFGAIQDIASRYPENPDIQERLALAAFNVIAAKGPGAQEDFRILRELAAKHADNMEIQSCLASGAFNMMIYHAKGGRPHDAEKSYKVLIQVARSFPNHPEIQNVMKLCQRLFRQATTANEPNGTQMSQQPQMSQNPRHSQ